MRIIVLASTLAVLTLSSAAAQTGPRTTTIGTRITIDSGGRIHRTAERTLVSGKKARLEMGSEDTTLAGGMYMIFDSADSSMTEVMPKAGIALIIKMPKMNIDLDLPKVSRSGSSKDTTIDLGPGEPLLGLPTHHYRNVHSGTSTLTYSDRVCTDSSSSTQEYWLTTDSAALAIQAESDSAMSKSLLSAGMAGTRAWADSGRKRPKGMTLRSIRTNTIAGPDGARIPVTHTTEITELARAPFDSTLFAAPAGFRVQDMRAMTISGDFSKLLKDQMKNIPRPGCVAK